MPASSRTSTLRLVKQSIKPSNRQLLHTTCVRYAEPISGNGTDAAPSREGQSQNSRSALAARQISRLGRRRVQGIGMTRRGDVSAASTPPQGGLTITRTPVDVREREPQSRATSQRFSGNRKPDGNRGPVRSALPSRNNSDGGFRGPRPAAFSKPISAKEFQQRRDPSRRGGSRRNNARKEATEQNDANEDITPEEDKAAEELFWISKAQEEEVAAQQFNPGAVEHSDSLAINSRTLITNRTSSLAGASGPATQIKDAMGRMAQRPDDTWANDEDLSRRLTSGKLVQFKDAEERERVMKLANEKAVQIANTIAIRKNQPFNKREVGWAPITGAQREMLVGRVLKGQYELHDQTADKGAAAKAMGHVQTMLELKETQNSDARKMFLDTFKALWPAQTTGAGPAKPAKSAKKAKSAA